MQIKDEFGRTVRFNGGTHLVSETTEAERSKQWTEADIWRTNGGAYVVRLVTVFRVLHVDRECRRFGNNHIPRPAIADDWFPCPDCDPTRSSIGKFGVVNRCAVDVADSPADLVHSMKDQNGVISNFRRYLLSLVSEQDKAVHDLWMVVDVA